MATGNLTPEQRQLLSTLPAVAKQLTNQADRQFVKDIVLRVAAELWEPRVMKGEKYKAAWNLLRPDERKALELVLFDFKNAVQKLESVFADFVFDESNWVDVDGYGKDLEAALDDEEYEHKRGPVLELFRHIRTHEALAVMKMVDHHASRVYSDIPGSPTAIPVVSSNGVFQHVPTIFEGEVGAIEFKFAECPAEVQQVFREAKALLDEGFKPCGDIFDYNVSTVPEVEEKGVAYSQYLAARGFLVQAAFHAAVAAAISTIEGAQFQPGRHKGNTRLNAKAEEYMHEGVPWPSHRAVKDTVRCSVVCVDHASLVAAHQAVLGSAVLEGKVTKDRREVPSCRDVLQVVEFREFLCEVQFHFAATLPLKAFSHAAYNIRRPDDRDLTAFDTIFDFPGNHMETETRIEASVRTKLHF